MPKSAHASAVRSRQALQDALLELITQRPFDRITLRSLTLRAGVSYPTFFRNFSTKEDILSEIAAHEIRALTSLMLALIDRNNPQLSAEAICQYVQTRRGLWKTLLTTGAASVMREEFINSARRFVRKRGRINPGLPVELTATFTVGAMFEILVWWLRQPKNYPTLYVSKVLTALVLKPAHSRHRIQRPRLTAQPRSPASRRR